MKAVTITNSVEKDIQFFNWLREGYVDGNMDRRNCCKGALQVFMRRPAVVLEKNIAAFKEKQLQGFSVSTDFSILPRGFYDLTIEETNFDMGWEMAFKQIPKDANIRTWTIYTAGKTLTFNKIPEGGSVKIDEVSGSHITVGVDYYGGGLGWTDAMIRYREVAAMLDLASVFRNAFYTNKADNHYLLLAAAGALNITTYQGVVADGQLQRDVQSINQTAYDLKNANKDKGYGDTAQANLILYANPLHQSRIEAAFNVTTNALAAAGRTGVTVMHNIKRHYTFNSNMPANAFLLVLPGNKIQRAEDMAPTTYSAPIDVTTLNQVQTVWSIYGAAIADTDQVRRGNLA